MRRGLAGEGSACRDPSPTRNPGTLTCSSTRKMYQPIMSSSAEAAATAAMVPRAVDEWLRASAVRRGPLVSESAVARTAAAAVAAP